MMQILKNSIRSFFQWPRYIKNMIALLADALFLLFAIWFALTIRFETFYIPTSVNITLAILTTIVFTLAVFWVLGLYRSIVRYIEYRALFAIWVGATFSAVFLFIIRYAYKAPIPLSAIFSYGLFAMLLIGGSRLLIRGGVVQSNRKLQEGVLIYGAGNAGRQLVQALFNGVEYKPVAFVDDDSTLHYSRMLGLTVYPAEKIESLLIKYDVKRILLAMPSATHAQRKQALEKVEPLGIQVLSIPGIARLVSGQRIDALEEIKIEDLLGRDPVPPNEQLMDKNIRNKSVLVTGAGGSIGSELCRQILRYAPKKLVLFELSEYSLYAVEQDLKAILEKEGIQGVDIVPVLGNVQQQERLRTVFQAFGIQTVYHAAAYKHVPMVEYNIVEAVRNNVFGTWHAAEAAISANVESFVLISTDKAVRPTNVMGASKRMAELVLQALASRQASTCFCMVRFGNVLGSSGSVVPKFREQINAGGPVTVTHEDITRYFMTIPEASQLVIQAGAMSYTDGGGGGDVFVLDMGEPVKIAQLARKLIHLMGKSVKDADHPRGDIDIVYSGLRPGEKLYEELLIGDNVKPTSHPRIRMANEASLSWPEIERILQALDTDCELFKSDAVYSALIDIPLAFTPVTGMADLVFHATER